MKEKETSRALALRIAIVAAATLAALAYGRYGVPEPVSWETLLAIASIGVLAGVLAAALLVERRNLDVPKAGVCALLLIVATRALPYEQPAWLDAVRAGAVIACALLVIFASSTREARRGPLLLTIAGLALGVATGLVLLAAR
ncbi:MAG: hypothetical protein LOD94_01695 [Gammaproteobacteria bacterium]